MSFESLIKGISPTLRKITYKLNGHFTFFDDNDLFQEALTHLWVAYGEGRLADKTASYILQGCYFHLKNYIRKNHDKAHMVSMDMLLGNNEEKDRCDFLPIIDRTSYLNSLYSKIALDEIQNNGLTKRERQILSLCLEGLTTREIGKRLGISHVRVVKLRTKLIDKCKGELKI